ncbi:MAG: hypothetical protein AAB585_00205 [Patescibacteria group bacterium]
MAKIIDLRKKSDILEKPAVSPETNGVRSPVESIVWFGPLYYHSPDFKAVWVVVTLLWLTAASLQIFQKNITTTIFFVLLGLMIIIHAKKKPAEGEIKISPLGVQVGERSFNQQELKSFWIDYRPDVGVKELSLQMHKWYLPYIRVPLNNQNPVQTRSFLIKFIPEVQHEETLADSIMRRLGL